MAPQTHRTTTWPLGRDPAEGGRSEGIALTDIESCSPKLGIPVLPASSIRRTRLTAPLPLDTAMEIGRGTLVLVTGSVGAGKTTVMAEWALELQSAGAGVGWASLGSDDNEVRVLWDTLLGAIRNAVAGARWSPATEGSGGEPTTSGAGSAAARELRELTAPPRTDAQFVGRLATLLADARDQLWLFLDDVQVIRDADCLASLNQLLRWLPATCHLVIGARSDPALHLSRLRLQNRVREIRNDELRFSRAEAEAALNRHGVHLGDQHLTTLHALTEGWAAGLGLAALALRAGRDPEEFMVSFAGDAGAMAEYLMDELLSGLADETREFLLLTCVPERLTPELAEHLSGRDDAGAVLASLAETNSMVSVSRGQALSYRYHSLLRGYLNARLKALGRARFGRLHARTAQWFDDNGLVVEALEHAVVSQDAGVTSDILHRHGVALVLSGRGETVGRALEHAPQPVRADAPLQALAAVVALDAGRVNEAEQHLAAAETDPSEAERGDEGRAIDPGSDRTRTTPLPARRLIAVARLSAARLHGEVRPELLRQLDPGRPPSGSVPRNLRDVDILERVTKGMAEMAVGRYDAGATVIDETLALARRSEFDYTVMICLTQLAAAAAARGDIDQMNQSAAAALNFARPRGWSTCPSLLYAYLLAAAAAYSGCDLVQARRLCDAAEAILDEMGPADPDRSDERPVVMVEPIALETARAVSTYVAFAEAVGHAEQQRSIVRHALARIEGIVGSMPREMAAYELSEFHRMAVRTAQPDLASRAVEMTQRVMGLEGDAAAMRGLQELARGHHQEARAEVSVALDGQTPPSVVPSTATAWLVRSAAARHNDQPAAAHEALLEAVALCEHHQLVRLLVEFSEDTLLALRMGAGRFGRHEGFVERSLLTVAGQPPPSVAPARPMLASTLTPREMSLLQDLPSLMTVSEIAGARGVSPNTVKTQMRFLFTKLDVGTRRDAVAAGRQLGLI